MSSLRSRELGGYSLQTWVDIRDGPVWHETLKHFLLSTGHALYERCWWPRSWEQIRSTSLKYSSHCRKEQKDEGWKRWARYTYRPGTICALCTSDKHIASLGQKETQPKRKAVIRYRCKIKAWDYTVCAQRKKNVTGHICCTTALLLRRYNLYVLFVRWKSEHGSRL